MPVSHIVYGLRLEANVPVSGLAIQSESKPADVRIRLREPFPFPRISEPSDYVYTSLDCSGREQPNLRVAMDSHLEYFVFFYRDGARFAVRRDGGEVLADWPENYTLEDACTYLLGPIMGFVLRLRGITCLHASAVALGDSAIAFSGFPGAGKSTLAAAFARNGYPVLSDDVVAMNEEAGQFLVQPGYARLNLWSDSVRALFGSEQALPRITPTWDKRYLALDQNGYRWATEPLPLRAIYVLGAREAAFSNPVVEDIAGNEAFMALVANTYVNHLLDRQMRGREFDLLSRVISSVPIRFVRPVVDTSGLASLRKAILADATMFIPVDESVSTSHNL